MRNATYALTLAFLLAFLVAPVSAQEEEIGFDDVEEDAPVKGDFPSWVDTIHMAGRFDLNLEVLNPGQEDVQANRFRNYHKFLFLKVTPDDRFSLDAEILDLSYYELKAKLPADFTFSAGKIWVPFGLLLFTTITVQLKEIRLQACCCPTSGLNLEPISPGNGITEIVSPLTRTPTSSVDLMVSAERF